MSYRDLRNFTEMMRALGYKRLISMENFRTPNFPLVAEVLLWLCNRYDPNANVPSDIDTEQDRVFFIKAVAQFLSTRAHIRLNPKKLYQADLYAVRELLKVTAMLYSALRNNAKSENQTDDTSNSLHIDISSRLGDLKEARRLASDITSRGAKLFDLLGKEVDLREQRTTVLARPIDVSTVEKGISQSVKLVEADIGRTVEMMNNVASDEANLEVKIEKKKTELDRSQKRLATLQHVRPAYMDDLERLEVELKHLYDGYMTKHRNLQFLEQQMDDYSKAEMEKFEETEKSLRSMEEKIKTSERNGGDDELRGLLDDDDEGDVPAARKSFRNPAAPPNSMGMNLEDEDDDDDSDDDDDDDSDEDGMDDEEDEMMMRGGRSGDSTRPMGASGGVARRPSGAAGGRGAGRSQSPLQDSDDDF